MTPQEKLRAQAKLGAKCRYDPLLFAEKAWPWGVAGTNLENKDIRAWQSEVLDEIAQHLTNPETRHELCRVSVVSGHGIGKSALTGMLTTWALSCYRDPRIVITANSETQLRTKTSPEVGQWVRTSAFGDLFEADTLAIRLKEAPEQHRCDFITNSETNPEAFAGLHAEGRLVMILMDEASAIPEIIWETVMGALTDENTVLLWVVMGNGTRNTGYFRETHRRYRKYWKTWNIDSRTVEGTNRAALQEIIDQYGEHSDTAKVRVKGMFPSASSRQFIPSHYVDAAFGRHLREEQYDFAPVILTCDPAWSGDDELVIGLRQGLKFDILETMEKNDNDILVASKLAYYEHKHNADAVFIDAGYGTGIYSAGVTMGRAWQLVWFGEKATDPGFKNKRTEMWATMRQWLMQGGAIPADQKLYEDLIGPETKPHLDGLVALESKEEMKKKRLLPSPDRADALALSFAYPVERKAENQHHLVAHHIDRQRPFVANEEYDPELYR